MVKLTKTQSEYVDDLKAQAELFDMDVDWETLELIPKRPEKKLTYWEKINEERDYIPGVDEGVYDV